MKLLLFLAALVAVASCMPPKSRGLKSVFQFNEMINCATEEWFVSALWNYNGYGCYCGFGGEGVPVDATDQCCKEHDECYGKAAETVCWTIDTYLAEYKYTQTRTNGYDPKTCQITCTPEDEYYFWELNEDCKAFMCECDRQGALCFGRNADTWSDKYQGWSQNHCK